MAVGGGIVNSTAIGRGVSHRVYQEVRMVVFNRLGAVDDGDGVAIEGESHVGAVGGYDSPGIVSDGFEHEQLSLIGAIVLAGGKYVTCDAQSLPA